MPEQDDVIQIPNAEWWENHSYVTCREDFLASDEAWITNQLTKTKGMGTKNPQIEIHSGSIRILTVKRMVTGGLVAVKRPSGRIVTVHLPGEAEKLLRNDLDYIAEQIDKLNPQMTDEEQEAFLHSANGHFGDSLTVVK